MKIALPFLSGTGYGGLTYCMHVIPALAKADTVNEYHIFIQKDHPALQTTRQANFIFHRCGFSTKALFMRHLWEQFVLPRRVRRLGIDIIFTAKNMNIFFAPCKTIIAIQNIAPLYPSAPGTRWSTIARCWLLKALTRASVKKADRVVVVSRSNRDYLERLFPEARGKTVLSRNGGPVTTPVAPRDTSEKAPFLLTVSKFIAYANQQGLIEGYAEVRRRRRDLPPLWFVGGVYDPRYFRKMTELIRKEQLTECVKIAGLLPHGDLLKLYARAFAFIFPSTMETCPMVLIEAMACGVPIVASNAGPMPEVCQDAAIYFDPYDKMQIADAIESVLSDRELRDRLTAASLERSRSFDWDRIAVGLVSIFEEVHRGTCKAATV